MSNLWDALAPEVSTNRILNPTGSGGTANWAMAGGTSGGSITTDTTPANLIYDVQCLKCSGTLVGQRGIQGTFDVALSNAAAQVQFWIAGATPVNIMLGATNATPVNLGTEGPYTIWGASFTAGQANGQTTARCEFAAGAVTFTFYAQVEQSSTFTTFIYGDAGPGYIWNGTKGASSSTRYIYDQDNRLVYGGSVVNLDDGSTVMCSGFAGVGLLPYALETLALAGELPSMFVNHDLQVRDFTVELTFSNVSTHAALHTARAAILAKFPYGREVWLRYKLANTVLRIRAAVAGQFDLKGANAPDAYVTMIHFQAADPKFAYVYSESVSLTLNSAPSSSYVQLRTDTGGWTAMSSGLFAQPRRVVLGPDGTIYVGTLASGGTAKVQKWTSSAWTDVISCTGSLAAGPIIYDLVFNVDATKLYVIGDYTTVNAVAGYNGVCQVTLSGPTPATMGSGASGGAPLCGAYIQSLNRLYVGGLFSTNMGGVSNTSYYCYWNGSAWTSVGTTRPTAGVYSMVNDGNDNIVLGGDFTNSFALSSIAAPTVSAASGGDLTAGTDYYVWVIPCDGTNFVFNAPTYTSSGVNVTGLGVMGPTQRAVITPSGNNKQASVSWTAVPGAKYYVLWFGTLAYGDDSALSTGVKQTGFASGTYLYDAFGKGSLDSKWTNTNGTMTYNANVSSARYASGALKYTGTSLAANSGCVLTPSFSLSAGTWYYGAWVRGGTPDKFGRFNSGLWTYTSAPTASITDGVWTYYTASTTSAPTLTAAGIFFSGTGTWYVGYFGMNMVAAVPAPYVKYSFQRAYVVPAAVTSVSTANLIQYTSTDVPSWDYAPSSLTPSITDDLYLEEGTGSWGSRIVKHLPSTGGWERMAQSGGGFNGIVRALCWVGGALVAGGDFTTADNATANRVAYTRGKAWLPLGVSGMSSGSVNRFAYYNGTLWAAGSFASADGDTAAALVARMDAFPTGGWTHTDMALTNSPSNAYDLLVTPYRLVMCDDTNFSSAAGSTTIAYGGTANLYPRIVVTGPGVFRWLENSLTKARIVMNYTLQTGEVMVIDCAKATVVSNMYGDITDLVQISSNLDAFYLAASSTQTIFCHMTGTTGASSAVVQGNRALLTGDA